MMRPVWFLFLSLATAACDGPSPVDPPYPEDAGAGMGGDAAPMVDAAMGMPDALAMPVDAGTGDGGPPPRCIGSYAEGVAIFAAETYLVLRAHAEPEESAEVTAWPWQTSLGSVRPVPRDVEWRTEGDPVFVAEPVPDPRGRRLRLMATADAFDLRRSREPHLVVRACVANPCPAAAADGSPCSCEPEVCSPSIVVAAVPVLDGRWSVEQDGADLGTFDVVQAGRELTGLPFDIPLWIDGVGVQGAELGLQVQGAVAFDRRSITGLRLSEDGSEVIGPWSARRVD